MMVYPTEVVPHGCLFSNSKIKLEKRGGDGGKKTKSEQGQGL